MQFSRQPLRAEDTTFRCIPGGGGLLLRKSKDTDFEVMSVTKKSKELAGYLRTIREKLHRADKLNSRTATVLNVQEAHALVSIGTCGRMAMSEIADRLQLSLSSMTSVIDKLEKKKFVSRGRQKDDRRVVEVTLTSAGRKFYDYVEEAHVQLTEKFLTALSAGEQDTLLALFRKITANLK